MPFLGGGRLTLGASAPIFGLLGALVYYGRRGGSSLMTRSEAMGYAMTLFVIGFILPGVDNYAHAGGFVGGYLAGMWLDPLKPERMDHSRRGRSSASSRRRWRSSHRTSASPPRRLMPGTANLHACANPSSSSPAPAARSATA